MSLMDLSWTQHRLVLHLLAKVTFSKCLRQRQVGSPAGLRLTPVLSASQGLGLQVHVATRGLQIKPNVALKAVHYLEPHPCLWFCVPHFLCSRYRAAL